MKAKTLSTALFASIFSSLAFGTTYYWWDAMDGGGGVGNINKDRNWSYDNLTPINDTSSSNDLVFTENDTLVVTIRTPNPKNSDHAWLALNQATTRVGTLELNMGGDTNRAIGIRSTWGGSQLIVDNFNYTLLSARTQNPYMYMGGSGGNNAINLTVNDTANLKNESSTLQSVVYFGANQADTDYTGYFNTGMGSINIAAMNVYATKAYFQTTSNADVNLGNVTLYDQEALKAELVLKYNVEKSGYTTNKETQTVSIAELNSSGGQGRVTVEGDYSGVLAITTQAGKTGTYTGSISDSASGTGIVEIYKSQGLGTQYLIGTNTFTGRVTVEYGTLVLRHEGTTSDDTSTLFLYGGAFGNYGDKALYMRQLHWTAGGLYADFSMSDYGFTILGRTLFQVSNWNADNFKLLNIANLITSEMQIGVSTGNILVISFEGNTTLSGATNGEFEYNDGEYLWKVAMEVKQDGTYMNAELLQFVPEPSAYAALFGALALALTAFRRRRN